MTNATRDISFVVHAVPVAQPRQRHRIAGKGDKAFVQNYTPTTSPVNAYKAAVQQAYQNTTDLPPTQEPVRVWLTFVMPRPARLIWKTKTMPRQWDTRKPDLDNLEKSTFDCLEKLAFANDSQIAWKNSQKLIAAGDEQPHVEIRIACG